MSFSSSLLLSNKAQYIKENSITKLITSDNDHNSYLYNLLEFNAQMHEIDVVDNYNFFKAITESSSPEVLNENIASSIVDAISKAIQTVIDFLGKFVGSFRSGSDDKLRDDFNKLIIRNFNNASTSNTVNSYKFFYCPELNKINDDLCKTVLYNTIAEIELIARGQKGKPISEDALASLYKELARAVSSVSVKTSYTKEVNSPETFKEYVLADIIYEENKDCTLQDFVKFYNNRTCSKSEQVSNKIKGIKAELERCKGMIDKDSTIDAEERGNVNRLIGFVKTIIDSWCWYINMIYTTETKMIKYFKKVVVSGKNEASTLHGEEFTPDTLFDNEDLNDFNRTEWLDLQLTTECYELYHTMLESKKHIIIKEGLILNDEYIEDKVSALIAMQEAEGRSLGDNLKAIIARIKEIFRTFFAKLKDKYSKNARFIKRNVELIKSKPFNFTATIKSQGDILAGMLRVQSDKIDMVRFNYDQMKDELKDKKTFFAKYVLPQINGSTQYQKRSISWDENMSISEYCKAYYGASMPKDKYQPCEYNNSELESAKERIVKFLSESNTFLASIRRDIDTLEIRAKDAMRSEQASTSLGVDKTTTDANQKINAESYYSILKNEVLYEADIPKPEPKQDEGANNQQGSNQQGQDQQQTNNANDIPSETQAFKVYVDCYKDVLLSKITAIEFIIIELMQIIRAHAESYMSKEQIANERKISEAENKKAKDATNVAGETETPVSPV